MKDGKELFIEATARHMVQEFGVNKLVANDLANSHLDEVNTNDETVQQLGEDYYAVIILMKEGIIPYQSI